MQWLKGLPRLRKPHFYWPGHNNLPPENYALLADVLGTVNIIVDSNTGQTANLERLQSLAGEARQRNWTLGLHWNPLYNGPWKATHDPRISVYCREGQSAINWDKEHYLESVDGAIRNAGCRFRWFHHCENFKASDNAARLGLTQAEYNVHLVRLFDEFECETVDVIPTGSFEWYAMGWRQWNGGPPRDGVSHPQAVQRPYVPHSTSQLHRGQVVIDRPQYPEGWQTSYFASMTGRTAGTAWAWLWMAKQWISSAALGLDTAGGGRTPIEWRQSDVAGDYGMYHAREMGRQLARLSRVDKVCFYPRPDEWGDGTHLLHYVCGFANIPFTPVIKTPAGATVGSPAIPVAAVKAAEQIKPRGSA